MKDLHFIILLLILLPLFSLAEEELLIVNHRVFDKISKYEDGYNTSLVMFYDPKCPYCQRTLPEFKQAAKIIRERRISVTFGRVDLAVIPDLGKMANINKVPTIFYFNNGSEPVEITAHTYDEIVNFVMNAFHFHAVELNSLEEASKLFLESENVGIYYGKATDLEYQVFKDYLELHETINVAFAVIFNSKVINQLELNQSHKFTVIRKIDRENAYFFGKEFNVKNLKKFIDVEVFPVLMPFQHRILQDFLKRKYSVLMLLRKEDHKRSDKAQEKFDQACKKLRGEIQCVILQDKEEIEESIMEVFGLKSDDLPQVRILKAKTNQTFYKFQPDSPKITFDSIINFYQDYQSEKIAHYYKSEAIPEHNDGIIKKLVRENFQSIVYENSKDVFVLFHAKWCQHCNRAENAIKSIAQTLKNVRNLVFAEGNLAYNDFEDLEFTNLPTILFYSSNNKKKPIEFESITNSDNLLEFLKRYVTVDRANSLLTGPKQKIKEDL